MPFTLTAKPYPGPTPAAVQIRIVGDANKDILLYREDPGGRHAVRGHPANSGAGIVEVVDAEAPFQKVVYTLVVDGQIVARSNPVQVQNLPDDKALLRVVLRPNVHYMAVTVASISNMRYQSSSSRFPVIGSSRVVTVSDKRQMQSGVLALLVDTIEETDELIQRVLLDGLPIILRTPCDSLVRDMIFIAQDVEEVPWGWRGRRILAVTYQTVAWPEGATDVPPVFYPWTYQDLKDQTSAPTYGAVAVARANYLDLYDSPITP